MKERPILFSAPMVRAILEGRKTQTRRVVKPQPRGRVFFDGQWLDAGYGEAGDTAIHCPYGQPGDRLWVRETFKHVASGAIKGGSGEIRYGVAYKADGAVIWRPTPTIVHDLRGFDTGPMQFNAVQWKPSIHMPRHASRITLEVTDVRVQRLQDISEADAIAEGVQYERPIDPRDAFRSLWWSINGAASWDANPWVWAVSFQQVQS